MNDDRRPTHTVTHVPAAFPAEYGMAASLEVPPQPIGFPVAKPGYQYALQQPQTVQPVHQPGYQYTLQQPQTVQPVHQPAHYLSPQQPQTVQPVMLMVQQLPKEAPGQMMCPRCQTPVLSVIKYKRGALSWVLCSVLFAILCWPFFWIPLVADACKDVEHACPTCNTVLHVYKRK